MRLAAFDPSVRTLNGLAYSARQRYLNGLACACAQQNLARLGRLRGFGRLRGIPFADGNWNRMSGLGRLGQGDTDFEIPPVSPIDTTMYDDSGSLIAPTFSPAPSNPYAGLLPGIPAVTPMSTTMYNPTTGLIAPSMAPLPASSSPGQPSLTAAQVAATASTIAPQIAAMTLQPGIVAPATTLGIPNSYLLYGGIAFLGVVLLGSMSKKR